MSEKEIIEFEGRYVDINWYFLDSNRHIVSVASAGGRLPMYLGELSLVNDFIHSRLLLAPPAFKIARNPFLSEFIDLDADKVEEYFSTFDELAMRGVWAFDKVDISNCDDPRYILVSYPLMWPKCKIRHARKYWYVINRWIIKMVAPRSRRFKLPLFDLKIINHGDDENVPRESYMPLDMVNLVDSSLFRSLIPRE
ncbi:MAG: hypothetical protein PHC51_02450 [bacterium]|nr:hypothetical protein [bacterium]MDD2941805.1 hypothetical protein [bacterium]